MKRIALTVIGKDRPGIIARISRVLFELGCNIEDATMTILEGEFAMILISSVPERMAGEKWVSALERVGHQLGLDITCKNLRGTVVRGEKHPAGSKTHVLSVAGRDRTGIVYETSRILAKNRLNITDLNSRILGRGRKAVFAMILEVDIPRKFKLKRLEREWRRLKDRLKVDVSLRPVERLTL